MVHTEILATPSIPPTKGVWTWHGSTTIHAPARTVWSTIRDFSSYPHWNTYTPRIRTPSNTNAITPSDTITLSYRPDATSQTTDIPCRILEVDETAMRLSWRGCLPWIPAFVLLPEKVQRVTELGETECLYEVFETQAGVLAYVVMWALGEKQSAMAREQAESLKRFVEGELRQGQGQ